MVTLMLLFGIACSRGPDAAATPRDRARTTDPAGAPDHAAPSGPPSAPPRAEGDTASRVTLSPVALRAAGVVVAAVQPTAGVAADVGLDVPGQVSLDPARVATISPRVAGRIERLTAVIGDRVQAGQPVAYLTSPEFLTAQADYVQARRRATLLAGTADAGGATALATAARRRLILFGGSGALIARLDAGAEPSLTLPVPAPFGGSILEALATAGAAVAPGDPIFRLGDLSVVDVLAEVPERSLAAVREGQTARVTVPAFPGTDFAGRVVRLYDQVDSATRTVRAAVRVANTTRRLRPGMFASVRIQVPPGASAPNATPNASASAALLTIPESAVVTDGAQRYVFVEVGPRTYERRAVEVEPLAAPGAAAPVGRVIVRRGLAPGERVVVQGAFTLKSELAKGSLGESEG